jgi:S-DNA-T family DNA segregation ATPase FtsK/SpoIIIE
METRVDSSAPSELTTANPYTEYLNIAKAAEAFIEDFHGQRIKAEVEEHTSLQADEKRLAESNKELSDFEGWRSNAVKLASSVKTGRSPNATAFSAASIDNATSHISAYKSAFNPGLLKKLELKLNARDGAEHINSAGRWFDAEVANLTAARDELAGQQKAARAARMVDAKARMEAAQAQMEQFVTAANAICERLGAPALPWDSPAWRVPTAASSTLPIIRLAETATHCIGDREFRFPVLARIPGEHVGVSADARDHHGSELVTPLLVRALRAVPPGKLRILFIDSTTLGDAFSSVLGISDLSDEVIHTKVWTTEQDIRLRLEETTARVSLIIQKYLTGDYATIDEYNEQAGEVAEPYEIIAINDFPAGLDRRSIEMVQSLAEVGPRAGVSLLLIPGPGTDDDRQKAAQAIYNTMPVWLWPFAPATGQGSTPFAWCRDLVKVEEGSTKLAQSKLWAVRRHRAHSWHMDPAREPSPPPELLDSVLEDVGRDYESGSRVEVTLDRVWRLMGEASADVAGPDPLEPTTWWQGGTAEGIRIALGRQGSRGVCVLELNSKLQSSALLVGRPGSGKSNLLHNVIMSATAMYAPDELALYMLDFREAVEFAAYAIERLPHARAVALQADREFGLAVLQAVVEEIESRGALFRETGGEQASIVTYREATGESMPRILLVVDEFHRLFDREDAVAADAAHALDTIVRLGRGFGIHCLLASQTLMGMTALGRHTLNQVQVRIALQCLEEDARIVLSDGNNGPALLTRPGEGIFNAAAGREEHNQPFQAPLIPEEQRLAFLREMRKRSDDAGMLAGPVVYRRNETVLLSELPARNGTGLALRVGRPVSLQPQLDVALVREGSRNVLIVGRNEALTAGMLAASLEDLHTFGDDELSVELFDFTAAEGPIADVSARRGYRLRRRRDFPAGLAELRGLVESRGEGDPAGLSIIVVLNGLTKARDLDPDDFSDEAQQLAKNLQTIVRDGPEVGVHVIALCDSVPNLSRRLERRIQREFGIRIAFAMSSEDSQQLLDSEAAVALEDREGVLVDLDASQTTKFQPVTLAE